MKILNTSTTRLTTRWSAQETSRHLRGTAPGHDDGAGCHTAGAGPEGAADQRGGIGGDQGGAAGDGREAGAVGQGIRPAKEPLDTILRLADT